MRSDFLFECGWRRFSRRMRRVNGAMGCVAKGHVDGNVYCFRLVCLFKVFKRPWWKFVYREIAIILVNGCEK